MSRLVERYQQGLRSPGIWLNTADSQIAEIATAADFDWVCIDLQHGLAEMADLPRLLPILEKRDTFKIVRVLSNDAAAIGRVFDLGANGVIVPMIETVEEAAAAAAACRYPPTGSRSCGPTRAMAYDPKYLAHANDAVMCVVMIETAEGFSNVAEIAALPGVDALFVGPADLSFSLTGSIAGLGSQEFSDALDRVLEAGKAADVPVGVFGLNPDNAAQMLSRGFSFCSVSTDTNLFSSAVESARQSF
ncbi:MAG: aldolase/citrate lyase family protein [Pseudomonadota bacterium]|nr:aldolase/citrate lyase family protein [Pseudomonadota bacterium]